jgi:hypothetical protein
MTVRLIIVLILVSAFALAFAEMAKRFGGTTNPSPPCDELSAPGCRPVQQQ